MNKVRVSELAAHIVHRLSFFKAYVFLFFLFLLLAPVHAFAWGASVSGCIANACASVSANADSGGVSASGSASAGGTSASGSASVGGTTATTTVTTTVELQAVPLKTPEELAAEAEAMKQQLGQKLAEGKAKVEQGGQVAERTVLGGPSSVGINPGTLLDGPDPVGGGSGAPAPPPVVGEAIGDILGGRVVGETLGTIGGGPGAIGEAGQRASDEAKRGAEQAGDYLAARASEVGAQASSSVEQGRKTASDATDRAAQTGQGILGEVVEGTDRGVDKAGGATAAFVGRIASKAKAGAGKGSEAADSAVQTGRNILGEVIEGTDRGVDKVGGATAAFVGRIASKAKAGAGKGSEAADSAAQTGRNILGSVADAGKGAAEDGRKTAETNAANPTIPLPVLGGAPIPMPNPPPDGLQDSVQEGIENAKNTGKRAADQAADDFRESHMDQIRQTREGKQAAKDAADQAADDFRESHMDQIRQTREGKQAAKDAADQAADDFRESHMDQIRQTREGKQAAKDAADQAADDFRESHMDVIRETREGKQAAKDAAQRAEEEAAKAAKTGQNIANSAKEVGEETASTYTQDRRAEIGKYIADAKAAGKQVADEAGEIAQDARTDAKDFKNDLDRIREAGQQKGAAGIGREIGAELGRGPGDFIGQTIGAEKARVDSVEEKRRAGDGAGIATVLFGEDSPAEEEAQRRGGQAGKEEGARIGGAIGETIGGAIDKATDWAADKSRGDGTTGQGSQSESESPRRTTDSPPPQQAPIIVVWDGAIEVGGRLVKKNEALRATADGQLVSGNGKDAPTSNAPRPDQVQVDSGFFGGGEKLTERALYVWVRDGAIKLNRGGKTVEVAAGNAVVVTKDQVAQLDYVPNFLRFDQTPQPGEPFKGFVLPPFVMTDGSVAGSCSAK